MFGFERKPDNVVLAKSDWLYGIPVIAPPIAYCVPAIDTLPFGYHEMLRIEVIADMAEFLCAVVADTSCVMAWLKAKMKTSVATRILWKTFCTF